jgi:rubrerythrin
MAEENVLSMLERALAQQRRSVKAYEMMALAAPGAEERELLQTIKREDRRHYYLLEGIYEELSGHACSSTRVSVAMPKSYVSMLQVMICDKLEVIDYYEKLNQALDCVKQKELMDIIVSDQKEQARILATIYKNIG